MFCSRFAGSALTAGLLACAACATFAQPSGTGVGSTGTAGSGAAGTTGSAAAADAAVPSGAGMGAGSAAPGAIGTGTGTGTRADPASGGTYGTTGSGIGMGGSGTGAGAGTGAAGTASAPSPGWSMLPYTASGWVGLSVGRASYDTACGAGPTCDDPDLSFKVYTGGMFTPYLGVELGYLNFGEADRAGGSTSAQGLNLGFVGRVPVSASLGVFAKVGATWARTEVTADALSGVGGGKDTGWGLSYGFGASADLTTRVTAVLEWERHDLPFADQGRQSVDNASLGLLYRF
jgi:OOP family OmpA-OmpF porin